MNKRFLLVLFLTLFFCKSISFAQDILLEKMIAHAKKDTKTFNIQSLEGKAAKVKVLPDYVNHILYIIYLTDTIEVFDYWGVPAQTSHLSKQFIKIDYDVRGGSNFGLGNSLIICVSNYKLYEALHVLRYTDWESELVKTYNVKLVVVTGKKGYTLAASIRDKSFSTKNPETNYDYTSTSKLHFDKKLKVFYSIKNDLYDTLKVVYPNTNYVREIQGNFPEVILEDNKYVFIGGQWFELNNREIVKY
jgi:hypothetical protein